MYHVCGVLRQHQLNPTQPNPTQPQDRTLPLAHKPCTDRTHATPPTQPPSHQLNLHPPTPPHPKGSDLFKCAKCFNSTAPPLERCTYVGHVTTAITCYTSCHHQAPPPSHSLYRPLTRSAPLQSPLPTTPRSPLTTPLALRQVRRVRPQGHIPAGQTSRRKRPGDVGVPTQEAPSASWPHTRRDLCPPRNDASLHLPPPPSTSPSTTPPPPPPPTLRRLSPFHNKPSNPAHLDSSPPRATSRSLVRGEGGGRRGGARTFR